MPQASPAYLKPVQAPVVVLFPTKKPTETQARVGMSSTQRLECLAKMRRIAEARGLLPEK